MNAETEPRLAPPGAGLPAIELFVARLMFAWNRKLSDREKVNARFQAQRVLIRDQVRSCEPADAAKRVLIARVRGLEDSSRYWSVLMTLDHLRIVHDSVIGIIKSLAASKIPPRKASTANVKPSPAVDSTVIGEYEASCDQLVETVASIPDLRTRTRFEHPWFGPLNAAGWHALAANHIAIHRVQIARILAGLRATNSTS